MNPEQFWRAHAVFKRGVENLPTLFWRRNRTRSEGHAQTLPLSGADDQRPVGDRPDTSPILPPGRGRLEGWQARYRSRYPHAPGSPPGLPSRKFPIRHRAVPPLCHAQCQTPETTGHLAPENPIKATGSVNLALLKNLWALPVRVRPAPGIIFWDNNLQGPAGSVPDGPFGVEGYDDDRRERGSRHRPPARSDRLPVVGIGASAGRATGCPASRT